MWGLPAANLGSGDRWGFLVRRGHHRRGPGRLCRGPLRPQLRPFGGPGRKGPGGGRLPPPGLRAHQGVAGDGRGVRRGRRGGGVRGGRRSSGPRLGTGPGAQGPHRRPVAPRPGRPPPPARGRGAGRHREARPPRWGGRLRGRRRAAPRGAGDHPGHGSGAAQHPRLRGRRAAHRDLGPCPRMGRAPGPRGGRRGRGHRVRVRLLPLRPGQQGLPLRGPGPDRPRHGARGGPGPAPGTGLAGRRDPHRHRGGPGRRHPRGSAGPLRGRVGGGGRRPGRRGPGARSPPGWGSKARGSRWTAAS